MQGKKRKEKRHTTPVKHTVIIINVIIMVGKSEDILVGRRIRFLCRGSNQITRKGAAIEKIE